MNKGSIPTIALIRIGDENSMVLKINECLWEYMKYLVNETQAKKQPKPMKTSHSVIDTAGFMK